MPLSDLFDKVRLTPEQEQDALKQHSDAVRLAHRWIKSAEEMGLHPSVVIAATEMVFSGCLVEMDSQISIADAEGQLVGDDERIALHVEAIQLYARQARASRGPQRSGV